MYLIADSGSTSCKWAIVNNKGVKYFKTSSINLYLQANKEIDNIIKLELLSQIKNYKKNIQCIKFFGTSLKSDSNKQKLNLILKKYFSKNVIIDIETDIFGSCLASQSLKKSIICILGTGSNLALWTGKKILLNRPGLGYLLGDEGSGFYLAKIFIQKLLYDEISNKLKKEFYKNYNLSAELLMHNIYENPKINAYLAHFVPFIFKYKKKKEIKQVILQNFTDFLENHLKKIKKYQELPIYFTGSIAWNFRNELKVLAQKMGCSAINFIEEPIKNLSKLFTEA